MKNRRLLLGLLASTLVVAGAMPSLLSGRDASAQTSGAPGPSGYDLSHMRACPAEVASGHPGTADEAAQTPMNSSTMCRFTGQGTPDPFPAAAPSGPANPVSEPAVAVGANCYPAGTCNYQTGLLGGGNAYGTGSNLGIAVPGLTNGWAYKQWYSNWVGVQNTNNPATANFIQIGWQWVNGQSDYVFVQQWLNGNNTYSNSFTQFNLGSGAVKSITVRVQTSGNNLYYPFILWGGRWVNVAGYFNMGFSNSPYPSVIGEGTVKGGAPIPTLPTETNSGNIAIKAGTQTWVNWPWNASQYAPPYCLYSSSPWTSYNTWNEPSLHC
ncbi:MAG TPA: hypothetical protein VFZ97_19270 [Acidimicrobiales bacterium]